MRIFSRGLVNINKYLLTLIFSWTLVLIPWTAERSVIQQEGFTTYGNCKTAGNQLFKYEYIQAKYLEFACFEVK